MAKFKSIVTDGGSEALTALIASGQKLILTRAAAGSGVAQVSPFLSTPSARRATGYGAGSAASWRISIHALREEGDRRVM